MERPSVLSRIRELDATRHMHDYLGLVICEKCVGQVQKKLVPTLLACTSPSGGPVFRQVEFVDGGSVQSYLEMVPDTHPTEAERTQAMAAAAAAMGKKPKHEQYAISERWGLPPLCTVDRSVAAQFGAISPGVHLICYVRNEVTSELSVWVGQRAASKSSYPSLYDPTVAGGTPAVISLQENMEKEAQEEASVPAELARTARSAGVISQMTASADGSAMKHSLYFIWELCVAPSFVPAANDGEVAQFELWSEEKCAHEVETGAMLRPAMRLVFADFLIRHGYYHPDALPDMSDVQSALHQPRSFPSTPYSSAM
jgi:isopentenyldiphosphate isomerase